MFPNAQNGVKRIFTAEIFKIIMVSALTVALCGVVLFAAARSEQSKGLEITAWIIMIAFGTGTAVLGVISLVFALVGLKKASIDEASFKYGFVFASIALVPGISAAILSFTAGDTVFDDLLISVSGIVTLCVTLYVIKGVRILAEKLDNLAVASKGRELALFYAISMILFTGLRLVYNGFLEKETAIRTVVQIVLLFAAMFSFVAYIIYLVYLAQAKKMLAEN